MGICYSDQKDEPPKNVPYEKWNAVKGYLKHFENSLYLSFLLANSHNRAEKAQASKELTHAEKCMERWKSHPNYDQARVNEGCQKLKSDWKM